MQSQILANVVRGTTVESVHRGHFIVMDGSGKSCARVHGYLHRLEGDLDNAGYWYRTAGVAMPTGGLKAEWSAIARDLLAAR